MDINVDRVSAKLASNFEHISSVADIISLLLDDAELTDEDRMFSMFAMGRRYENNRIYNGMVELIKYEGKVTDPDEDDIPDDENL